MFGEYGIYCDGRFIGVICNNIIYIKKTETGSLVCPNLGDGSPYKGAKPHFIFEEVEDNKTLARFIAATCEGLFAPQPKKKK